MADDFEERSARQLALSKRGSVVVSGPQAESIRRRARQIQRGEGPIAAKGPILTEQDVKDTFGDKPPVRISLSPDPDSPKVSPRELEQAEGRSQKVRNVLAKIDDEGSLAGAIQSRAVSRTEARLVGFTNADIDRALDLSRRYAKASLAASEPRAILRRISDAKVKGNSYDVVQALDLASETDLRKVFGAKTVNEAKAKKAQALADAEREREQFQRTVYAYLSDLGKQAKQQEAFKEQSAKEQRETLNSIAAKTRIGQISEAESARVLARIREERGGSNLDRSLVLNAIPIPFAWTNDAYTVVYPETGPEVPTQASIASATLRGQITEAEAKAQLADVRANKAVVTRNPDFSDLDYALALTTDAALLAAPAGKPLGALVRRISTGLRESGATAAQASRVASALRAYEEAVRAGSVSRIAAAGRALETAGRAAGNLAIANEGANVARSASLIARVPAGGAQTAGTVTRGITRQQFDDFARFVDDVVKQANQKAVRDVLSARGSAAGKAAREATLKRQTAPKSATPSGSAETTPAVQATRRRLETSQAGQAAREATLQRQYGPKLSIDDYDKLRAAARESPAVKATLARIQAQQVATKGGVGLRSGFTAAQFADLETAAARNPALRETLADLRIKQALAEISPVIALATPLAAIRRARTATAVPQGSPRSAIEAAVIARIIANARTVPALKAAANIANVPAISTQSAVEGSPSAEPTPTTTSSEPTKPSDTPTRRLRPSDGGDGGSRRNLRVRFKLPDNTLLPEGKYPKVATFLMGPFKHTVYFDTGKRKIESSSRSGEPDETFRVTDFMDRPPEARTFGQGAFKYRINARGIRFNPTKRRFIERRPRQRLRSNVFRARR